ncbi:MAG: hypothetical protein A2Y00_00260 [Omnitrophica WOR_2 bacterium GWF2_43_52]|nr:MAG: hypothetical protein A2Y01_07915 [Omnitrophica WOR_2 bacterium GWC2_44_8]OGX20899.1 MAG: hypothetical protein A2Y00_00260 [Omnitrophica WOR_2 bacterium GWF2_43_52]HAH21073.1 TIGR03960 family radical SAM protein [Candidatus Omnitrophota bacterium]HBG63324.1 TIGR03960 family B12-binding radical SAM protein [Candidatus Omnitrophota bacterium]HCD37942.1 TIGR03960 family B12-binding radical SAM protein [Candidatus Omnitrophota bacterium]
MKRVVAIEDILLQVRKPGRYVGNEWNAVKKDFDAQEVTFALCFPDLYEIGMSNMGLRILYGLLNEEPGIACERAFLPDVDMQGLLKEKKLPLFSLESKIPLSEFDFLGFCLNYELAYTNVLAVLDLAGIPLLSKDRSLAFPLVIAGGPCVTNPEPLADFIDIFFIGEAEEALLEIVEIYKSQIANHKSQITKEDILKKIAAVRGVYIPSFYDVDYDEEGAVKKFLPLYPGVPQRITKRIVEDLNNAYYPQKWLVPYIQIVHDRAAIELMRGCPHHCSFCQARVVYQKLRIRSPEKIIEITENILRSSGYEEISFLSLSTSEYPFLRQVLDGLRERMQEQAVAISLPSLRPKSYLGNVTEYLSRVRKTTLTFAPEAGSERMRQAINKNFDIEEFYAAIRAAYKAGWQSIKLYFMLGLPDETYDDLDALIALARQVSFLRKEYTPYLGQVHASISFFVPKPHTAFERVAMDSLDVLREKRNYLRKKAQCLPKAVRLDFHALETSLLEAVVSRGNRRLGKVLLKAYQDGCMLDGWTEHFKFNTWRKAFEECQRPMESYCQALSEDTVLPWQHIVLTA